MRFPVLRAVALLVVTVWASPARAELVFFQSGRALSVKKYQLDGDTYTLHLRSGGEISCGRELIARIEPDEIAYPEDVVGALPSPVVAVAPPPIPDQYKQIITDIAARHGVDLRLVHAVIQVESAYQSRARSGKGAMGLMQLLPSTGRQYGARDLYDPKVNIDAGIQHLKSLLKRFDLPIALAAYNAGEAAVARFGGIPPFKETQEYVRRILQIMQRG